MASLIKLDTAVIHDLDAAQRSLTLTIPAGERGHGSALTLTVDAGALVATKRHQLMKLEDFHIGQRVSVIYSPSPGGLLVAKAVILLRGGLRAAGLPAQR